MPGYGTFQPIADAFANNRLTRGYRDVESGDWRGALAEMLGHGQGAAPDAGPAMPDPSYNRDMQRRAMQSLGMRTDPMPEQRKPAARPPVVWAQSK
jgi:hypothetical protein